MSADWPRIVLGDVISLLTGFPFKSKDYSTDGTGYRLLRGDNVVQGSFRWEDVKRWPSPLLNDRHTGYWLREGDVVLAMDRPWIEAGLKFAQVSSSDLPCLLVQRVACLRSNGQLDQNFLRYLIASYSFVEYVKQVQTGTAVPHISGKQILAFEFNLPPKAAQRKIGSILKALDDKVQLNHQINQTLEQMAQAIFKSWFVDFEPVKAKIAARERWHALQPGNEPASPVCYAGELDGQPIDVDLDTYMNLAAMQAISGKDADQLAQMQAEQPEQYAELYATAELFPSAMQDSELGGIPEGWEVREIGNEVTVVGGGTPSTKNSEFWEGGNIHWTTPKDLSNLSDKVLLDTERKITHAGLAKISSGLLPVDTVLMSSRAPVGYLALAKKPVAVNQGYIAMKCEGRLSPEFVIQWCSTNMPEIKGRASGTTFAEISKKNFKIIPVIVPAKSLVSAYTASVKLLYDAIEVKVRESMNLAQLRDTLLPKLLSGELTLSEAEAEFEEVARA